MEADDLAYFDVDEPVSEVERAFLSAIRRQTEGRMYLWCAREGWSEPGPLLVGLHIDAPEVALLTVGVRVNSDHLHGDRLDHQSYVFPDTPSSLAIDSDGSPDALAATAVTWFETLLGRPIVRQEWLHDGRVYAQRYVFADTGEPLVQSYRRDLAPMGQTEQLIRDGHVFGRGWIQTTGLGEPDQETLVTPRGAATN
jgi:hypothetical protein